MIVRLADPQIFTSQHAMFKSKLAKAHRTMPGHPVMLTEPLECHLTLFSPDTGHRLAEATYSIAPPSEDIAVAVHKIG